MRVSRIILRAASRALPFLLLALSFPSSEVAQQDRRPAPDDVGLAAAEEVGAQMQTVLQALTSEKPGGLPFHHAVLTLQTGTATEGGFTLDLVIFTLEHKSKKGVTATEGLTFGKSDMQQFEAFYAKPTHTLDELFKNDLQKAVAAAAKVTNPPLSKISAKREFAVSKDTKGGLTFKITALGNSSSVGGSIDKTKTSVNSIELVYSK